ncbi:disintegrin and metalloproteinase domain-containing protein 10-like [Rhopilema esculentum]|uniref:disintegrin and metalloproteinase domain-containing protein 10-like n=1 Tax=Rhopilema esculentum TaxID=499914 RepID=UPI0031CFF191|eukprot:gene3669-14918_t
MELRVILLLLYAVIDRINALASGQRNQLNKYIKHFEELNYDKNDLITRHLRAKRSVSPDYLLHLNFHSHGRYFPIRLKRDITIFSADFTVPDGNHQFYPSNIYEGWLEGEFGSKVNGFIHDNIFEGKIYTASGKEFHIEPAWKYLNSTKSHSVIYSVDDIHYPHPHGASCGIKKELKDWMKGIQTSALENQEKDDKDIKFHKSDDTIKQRSRRATVAKTSCHLYVQADWLFTDKFAKTTERAFYLMTQYVQSVNSIYNATAFTGYPHRVTLKISRMKAQTEVECNADANCKFKDANIGVAKFLELNSETDHDKHCLAYVFTYRDFADGVLGLAWIGEASGASGGVCERWKPYSGGKYKSLNTGVVTTLNYQQDVPLKVTEITLAHEIGHNFGAQHDPVSNSPQCSPGSAGGGNFIMYPRATSGSDSNNYKFSKCSRDYIGPVLNAKADICFKEPSGPICGNKFVEEGEQCDCGYEDDCKNERCCNKYDPKSSNNCKYNPANVPATNACSTSEGPCCDASTCSYNTSIGQNCSLDTECARKAACDGSSPKCPSPPPKPDIVTTCQKGAKVCLGGMCNGSICLKSNETECMCTAKEAYCDICCMMGNDKSTCKSKTELKSGKTVVLKMAPGSPCDNYLGYCDIFDKCRKVDAEGPLSRLKNFIFSKQAIDSIYTWMKERWWACVLIGLGLILFMACFIKVCSVHTPSSNPNRPPARPMTLPRTISRRNKRNPTAPTIAPQEEPLPSYDTAVRAGRPKERHQMRVTGNY